jgi:hypothetical protein|nr:MAG TPA: hypothetical protein [Caudoviricetes sp.]
MKLGDKLRKITEKYRKNENQYAINYITRLAEIAAKEGKTSYTISTDKYPHAEWGYIVNYFTNENCKVTLSEKEFTIKW